MYLFFLISMFQIINKLKRMKFIFYDCISNESLYIRFKYVYIFSIMILQYFDFNLKYILH